MIIYKYNNNNNQPLNNFYDHKDNTHYDSKKKNVGDFGVMTAWR